VQIELEANSTIGEKSFFEGRFAVKGNMKIDGKFEGETLLVDQLQVGARAKVKTNISATSVVVEGIVLGNIAATRRILLLSTARVLGDIKTPELIIQDGVVLEGRCTISHFKIDNTRQYIQDLYTRGENDQPAAD
jgi:cytoskeletal protein CcmA (bactofilin family)